MTTVALNEVKDHLSEYVLRSAKDRIVITMHGRPAAVLIGFESEDDWFEYQLLNDPRFLRRIEESRAQAQRGETTRLEDLPD